MKVKLVSESLQENNDRRLNEDLNLVSEGALNDFMKAVKDTFKGINAKYEALDKNDEKALREFAFNSAVKTYVADNPEAGKKAIKAWAVKSPIEAIKKHLEAAAADKFWGRTSVAYVQGKPQLAWKKLSDVKLDNPFKSGGTGGHTASGGV